MGAGQPELLALLEQEEIAFVSLTSKLPTWGQRAHHGTLASSRPLPTGPLQPHPTGSSSIIDKRSSELGWGGAGDEMGGYAASTPGLSLVSGYRDRVLKIRIIALVRCLCSRVVAQPRRPFIHSLACSLSLAPDRCSSALPLLLLLERLPAFQDHLIQLVHALGEALADDGARRLDMVGGGRDELVQRQLLLNLGHR